MKSQRFSKKHDIKIVLSRNNNLINLLGNMKNKPKKKKKSGIYQIKCENCDRCDIVQTSKNIAIIFEEHIKNQETYKWPIDKHVLEINHNINEVKLLKYDIHNQILNIKETMKTLKNKEIC